MKPEQVSKMQTAVFVMCGGGMLGGSAARQPADFYIDSRCGRLPYGKRQIMRAVEILAQTATLCGMDPHDLEFDRFHNLGMF
jgi:hypothetical protein